MKIIRIVLWVTLLAPLLLPSAAIGAQTVDAVSLDGALCGPMDSDVVAQTAVSPPSPPTFSATTLAAQFAVLNEINGAVFDEQTGQLIFVGRQNPDLPPLQPDDFVMALRLIYSGEAPAVSIDPTPDDLQKMQVVYFGGIENTHFGWVLFESDRLLKIYSMGRNNLDNAEVVSAVDGYQSELDLTTPTRDEKAAPLWHRMWFEPANTEQTAVQRATNRRAILFSEAQLTIKTEYITDAEDDTPANNSDPAAEAFVAHFNEHFRQFAAEQPVLHELAMLQRFLIIARWLRDEQIPIDLAWLTEYPVAAANTPQTTPRIRVSRDFTDSIVYLEGGVDFTVENVYADNSEAVNAMQAAVLQLPFQNGFRQTNAAFNGIGDSVTTVPLQPSDVYWHTDERGTWIYDKATGRPLSFMDGQDGRVFNFDAFDAEGQLTQMTINTPDNQLSFTHSNGELVDVAFAQEESERDLLGDFLDSNQAMPLIGSPSTARWIFANLFGNNWLGKMVVTVYNRFAVILMHWRGSTAIYVDEAGGVLTVQRGRNPVQTFSTLQFDALSEALDALAHNAGEAEMQAVLGDGRNEFDQLITYLFPPGQPQLPLVMITGLTRSPEETAEKQRLTVQLALEARRRGIRNVSVDDDPRIALANLDSHCPIVGESGEWDLALIIDESSFTTEQLVEVERIRALAVDHDVPVCENWDDEDCDRHNVLFLTARPDLELQKPPSGSPPTGDSGSPLGSAGAAGLLNGRYIALLSIGQESPRDYVRQFVTTYGATGVLAYDGAVELDSATILLEALFPLARANSSLPPLLYDVVGAAVEDALGRPDLTDRQRSDLSRIQTGLSYISTRPLLHKRLVT